MAGKSKNDNNVKKKTNFFTVFISFFKDERFKAALAVLILLFSVYLVFAFVSYLFTWQNDNSKLSLSWFEYYSDENIVAENWAGKTGAYLSDLFIHRWFGLPSVSFIILLVVLAFRLLNVKLLPLGKTIKYLIFLTLWTSVTLGYLFGADWFGPGGDAGYRAGRWLNSAIGVPGTFFLLCITAFIFIIFVFRDALQWFKKIINKSKNTVLSVTRSDKTVDDTDISDNAESAEESLETEIPPGEITAEQPVEHEEHDEVNNSITEIKSSGNEVSLTVERKDSESGDVYTSAEQEEIRGDYDPRAELPGYKFPHIDLLEEHGQGYSDVSDSEIVANKDKIVDTLKNYNIQIDKIKATVGPTVTLYEIVPAPGVKISRIRNLEDDIALSLAALGIRIIAPIPGKGTIGIEVPNLSPETVSMRSVINSTKFKEAKFDLPIAIGKTIQNEVFVFDLTRSPHLLVAGATGQGKSVGLNAILTSLLFRKHPAEIKFVLIDPKKVELSIYSRIENHFLAKLPDEEEAIITDVQKVKNTLKSLTIEMGLRYDLLKQAGTRTVQEYNEKFLKRQLNPGKGHRYLPYIVIVIDEFADLIQTAGREIEEPIARLAQVARAIGLHLIIATQRPSTNIITGSIKANFPSRIAFRVTSMVDSRTILDTPGANQLIGRGDMLISLGGDIVRLQCAFIDTPEITKITDFIASQQGPLEPFLLPEPPAENDSGTSDYFDPNKRDELFEDAAKIIVINQQGSTSLIQRKFSIGYNRAGRIIDQLENAGIVGPNAGSKPRQVLFSDLIALEQYLNSIDTN